MKLIVQTITFASDFSNLFDLGKFLLKYFCICDFLCGKSWKNNNLYRYLF